MYKPFSEKTNFEQIRRAAAEASDALETARRRIKNLLENFDEDESDGKYAEENEVLLIEIQKLTEQAASEITKIKNTVKVNGKMKGSRENAEI